MRIGVNVPNFGPGTDPGSLRGWARTVEDLGLDLLMVSDHVAVTPDVAEQYPEPFYAVAAGLGRPAPAMAPRIALRLTASPVTDPARLAGEGTIEQVLDDLDGLRRLGAEAVVLDPFNGDPSETLHPEAAWRDVAAVTTGWERRTGDARLEEL